jgi:hypothetical protein
VLLCLAARPALAQTYPENVMAAFCEADARGARLQPARGAMFADVLGWRFEPAWDRIFLISGFEVNPVRVAGDEAEMVVRYSVAAEITGEGVREQMRLDTVHVNLAREGGVWRIVGPPPAPHLYESGANRDELFALLTAVNPGYLSNSKFVWRLFQNAGWNVPYQPAAAYLSGTYFKPVAEPKLGDVVAYLDDGAPYHIGIYEGEDRVASATLGQGVVRAGLNTFPGEVRYLRLTEAARAPAPTPERESGDGDRGPGTED